jgi:hypothetical protein
MSRDSWVYQMRDQVSRRSKYPLSTGHTCQRKDSMSRGNSIPCRSVTIALKVCYQIQSGQICTELITNMVSIWPFYHIFTPLSSGYHSYDNFIVIHSRYSYIRANSDFKNKRQLYCQGSENSLDKNHIESQTMGDPLFINDNLQTLNEILGTSITST